MIFVSSTYTSRTEITELYLESEHNLTKFFSSRTLPLHADFANVPEVSSVVTSWLTAGFEWMWVTRAVVLVRMQHTTLRDADQYEQTPTHQHTTLLWSKRCCWHGSPSHATSRLVARRSSNNSVASVCALLVCTNVRCFRRFLKKCSSREQQSYNVPLRRHL